MSGFDCSEYIAGLDPAALVTHDKMRAWVADELAGPLPLCHGDWYVAGPYLAALALYEAMSECSEERICAAWEVGNGHTIWRWLQTGEMFVHGPWTLADFDDTKAKIIALANVSGYWWASYEHAVTLREWVRVHGPAPGISETGGT